MTYQTFGPARKKHETYKKAVVKYHDGFLNDEAGKIAVWNLINGYLKRSADSGWNGPDTDDLQGALGFDPDDFGLGSETYPAGKLIEDPSKAGGKTVPKFVTFGQEMVKAQKSAEDAARAYVSWLDQGAVQIGSDTYTKFREEFGQAFYTDQVRIAADVTAHLSATYNGRVFLKNLFTDAGAVFDPLDFFDPPTRTSPQGHQGVGINDRSSLFRSDGTIDPAKAPTQLVANLARIAANTVPGLVFHYATADSQSVALGELGKFFAGAVTAFVPASRLQGADVTKFENGTVTAADFKTFGEALLGEAETVLDNATEAEDAAESASAKVNGHLAATGITASRAVGSVNYLLNLVGLLSFIVEKLSKEENLTMRDVADLTKAVMTVKDVEDVAAVYGGGATKQAAGAAEKAGVDASEQSAKEVMRQLTGNKAALNAAKRVQKVAGELLGPLFDVLDIVWNYLDMQDAIDRGDYSQAVGYGMLGISSASAMVATVAGTTSATGAAPASVLGAAALGPWAFAIAVVLAVVGWGLLAFTADHPLETWIENGYFGTNWSPGDAKYNDPAKQFYNWDNSAAPGTLDLKPRFDRMLSSYFTLIFPVALNKATVEKTSDGARAIVRADGVKEFYEPGSLTIAPIIKGTGKYKLDEPWHRIRVGGRPDANSLALDPKLARYIYEQKGLFVDRSNPHPSYADTSKFAGDEPNFRIRHTVSRTGMGGWRYNTTTTIWQSVFWYEDDSVVQPSQGTPIKYLLGIDEGFFTMGSGSGQFVEVTHVTSDIHYKIGKMLKRGDLSTDPAIDRLAIVPREQFEVTPSGF